MCEIKKTRERERDEKKHSIAMNESINEWMHRWWIDSRHIFDGLKVSSVPHLQYHRIQSGKKSNEINKISQTSLIKENKLEYPSFANVF